MSIDTVSSAIEPNEHSEENAETSLTLEEIDEKLLVLYEQADALSNVHPSEWDAQNPDSAGYWHEMQAKSREINRLEDLRKKADEARLKASEPVRKAGGTGIKRFFMFKD